MAVTVAIEATAAMTVMRSMGELTTHDASTTNKENEEMRRRRGMGVPAHGDTDIVDKVPLQRREGVLNIKVVSWSLGIFTAVSFILCVVYGLIVPESLHMPQALEAVLPAFKWLTLRGFGLGLLESFLYGAYAGLDFVPIHNFLARRWSTAT